MHTKNLLGDSLVETVEDEFFNAVEAFTDRLHSINVEKGFFTPGVLPNVDQQLLLIITEVSEAYDAYRNHNANDDKIPSRKGLEVELGDAVIRILNFGRQMGLDIPGAIIEKTRYNANRPYKHGKAF